MKTTRSPLRIASILVLLASLALASGASAAAGTPVSGSKTVYFTAIGQRDSRSWTSDGWNHEKYYAAAGSFALAGDGVALSGEATHEDFYRADTAGNGIVHGVMTFTDEATGVICQGPHRGKITHWAIVGAVEAHCSDGSTLHASLQDTGVVIDGQGNVLGVITAISGTLQRPGE
jgi:hypothetical protein